MTGHPATTHVLLIGIDGYAEWPLRGCVNDVEAIQGLITTRLARSAVQLIRLVSPSESAPLASHRQAEPATLANIRTHLARLASAQVQAGDRVFIYYSGHGARPIVGAAGHRTTREALVPCDFARGSNRLLFDFELNVFLQRIAERAASVTVVLDCCHSAGAFRGWGDSRARVVGATRFVEVRDAVVLDPGDADGIAWNPPRGIGSVGRCTLVAACQADETAKELPLGPGGLQRGVFTWALESQLSGLGATQAAASVWGQVWRSIVAKTLSLNPQQNPALSAGWNRPILGGRELDGDRGYTIERQPDGAYSIGGGTLGGLSNGALLAVYGPSPARFPALGSVEDHRARLGTVRVTEATKSRATASATDAFQLPEGARARIAGPIAAERLKVSIQSSQPESIAALRSPLVDLDTTLDSKETDVLVRFDEGRWTITDTLHDGETLEPLITFAGSARAARAVLEHYALYRAPLWFARRCTDLPNGLGIRVLDCSNAERLRWALQQNVSDPELLELPGHVRYGYATAPNTPCCFSVENLSPLELGVALLNCASSGRVAYLGFEHIPASGKHIYWSDSNLGVPWISQSSAGRVDRLIALGTTSKSVRLEELRVDSSFEEVIASVERFRGGGNPPQLPALELWSGATATLLFQGQGS